MEKYTNALVKESSPYLMQHAHNPVDWVPWSEDVFALAKEQNKMVLISVGYSACHWCHVMEHESFEDEEVATLMNKFFINVKVDREERPDVDQVYMTAVQLMTQKGGWPLNCFTLPDGRPIYGGTYFPKEQWMHILKSLQHTFVNEKEKVEEYAQNLHDGIQKSELIEKAVLGIDFQETKLTELIQRWSKSFDTMHGGDSRAPKFPLPTNYEFLLDYSISSKNQNVRQHVKNSLDCMAKGGIYDQVGGGFARYSVDMLWKVPHFEKMLYDNGQLLSLYSQAYKSFPQHKYKHVVHQTVQWLEREMSDESGAFYSALDADSEGVEGKFYVWSEAELKTELNDDFQWVKDFYQVNQNGLWEDGNYILLQRENDELFAKRYSWTVDELYLKLNRVNELLLRKRSERIRPGTDDKCLTSWNAMALKGLCDAYSVFGEELYLKLARKNLQWLEAHQIREDGSLWRSYKNGESKIDAFLEDYAHVIQAYLSLYSVDMDADHLLKAKKICDYVIKHFGDETSQMFFFTKENSELIARKMELNDNVLPASNSVMARNLYYLGSYFHEEAYKKRARTMLANVYDGMEMYGSGYSNWAMLLNHEVFNMKEVVLGESVDRSAFQSTELPFHILSQKLRRSELPILEGKDNEEHMVYVCVDGACQMPTSDVTEALDQVIQS